MCTPGAPLHERVLERARDQNGQFLSLGHFLSNYKG